MLFLTSNPATFFYVYSRFMRPLLSAGYSQAARARILRGQRGRLMDELHRRQQVLDKVDYLIWQAENENGKQQKGR